MIRPFRAADGDAVARLLAEDPIPEGVTGDGIRRVRVAAETEAGGGRSALRPGARAPAGGRGTRPRVWSNDEEGGNFLRERGFRGIRTGELLRLELATADLSGLEGLRAAKAAEGYELVPVAVVADRPEELHAVDAQATSDVPGTYREDDFRLEDWLVETFAHPQVTREGSFVIAAAGRPSPMRSSTSTPPRASRRTT